MPATWQPGGKPTRPSRTSHGSATTGRYAARQGVRQFIDLGSGIPTAGNVHQIAQASTPGARVVYVDRDPVAAAESRTLLAGNPDATMVEADIRDLDVIFSDHGFCRLITTGEPVAIFLAAVLHS